MFAFEEAGLAALRLVGGWFVILAPVQRTLPAVVGPAILFLFESQGIAVLVPEPELADEQLALAQCIVESTQR